MRRHPANVTKLVVEVEGLILPRLHELVQGERDKVNEIVEHDPQDPGARAVMAQWGRLLNALSGP